MRLRTKITFPYISVRIFLNLKSVAIILAKAPKFLSIASQVEVGLEGSLFPLLEESFQEKYRRRSPKECSDRVFKIPSSLPVPVNK